MREKDNRLYFRHLPAYAQFLAEHHLQDFAVALLRISREVNVPLLKYFEGIPEETLVALSTKSTGELLGYFSQNEVREFIDQSVKSWTENQLPLIQYEEVVVEDISTISFARRKAFRDFLPLYSTDIAAFVNVMEEVDKFTITLEEICYRTLFELKQQKITEHHRLLERSEHQLWEAQEIAGLGSFEWDFAGQHSIFSPQLFKIFNMEGSTNLTAFLDYVHPLDREKVQAALQKAMQGDGDYDCEYRYGSGEQEKVVWSRGIMIFQDGKPLKMLGTVMDVTQRHYMLKRLEQNEETFRQLIANAPDAVIVIDENNIILLWNPKAEAMFGWKAEEVTGTSITETIIPAMYRERHRQGMSRLQETGVSRVLNKTIEITARKKNGEEFYIALSIARSLWEGKPVFISFIRDISKEKNVELELEEQRNQLAQKNMELERSNQELMAFNYIASHDLKEPVRKIKIFSSLLHDKGRDTLPENLRNYVERISVAANHMHKLIDALFTFSRTTSMEQNWEQIDLNILLEEVKYTLQKSIDEKQAIIAATDLPVLHIIPFQFRQLLENIIGNALKYSQSGVRPEINITVELVAGRDLSHAEAREESHYHAIAVSDNGIGFDQQYANKIFELFQRLHGKNEYSGTGIGLAICKKIVQHHHGFMTAHSEPGQGATFTIYIPVRKE